MDEPLVLAVESSCDDTSVAIADAGGVIAQKISSQTQLHEEYGGVVPELATREHLSNLSPLTDALFRESGVSWKDVDVVAATRGPGLPNALRTGYNFAQGIALQLQKPILGIHHHEAHLFSSFLNAETSRWELSDRYFPFVGLIASGGHTMIVLAHKLGEYQILGKTIDDAAGECFDKVAKLMGFPYPGGPHIDALAPLGNPKAHRFPRPMLHDKNFDFSFSGLKTSVRYFLRDYPGALDDESGRRDLCASIQAAIVEVLTAKTIRAALKYKCRTIAASGGVIANSGLRMDLSDQCKRHEIDFLPARRRFVTDNAGMIASLAASKWKHSPVPTPLTADILPVWPIDQA